MSAAASLLPELEDVIRHGSRERRAHTLMRVAALFAVTAENLNSDHIELFDDVFCRLVDEIDIASRIDLSKQLAPIDNAPPRTVLRLANDDEPAVAEAVLQCSRRLGDPELIELARKQSQGHLLALAGRGGISESLTHILVQRGGHDVLRVLVNNARAQFSDASLAALIEQAAGDDGLAEKLLLRTDLPPRLLRELLKHTPSQDGIRRVPVMADQTERAAQPRDYTAAESRIREMRQSGSLDEAAVLELAGNSQYEETIAALASLCAVPISVADRIVGGDRSDPILILCKAAGWGWATARAIMGLMPGAPAVTEQALDAIYVNFERLSPTTAQRVLRYWQVHEWEHAATP
jgi:uncharacterized protein (DUF2336 family)